MNICLSILFVVTVLLSNNLCDSQLNVSGCGRRPLISDDKIVGGIVALPGDWGWTVSMEYYGYHYCGGSLINREWVLLAAHCVYGDYWEDNYGIRVGMHERERDEAWTQYREVKKIIMHPAYNDATAKNDIALMKLSAPVSIDDNFIVPICLSVDTDLDNKTGFATGWGATYSGDWYGSKFKMQVAMPILSNADCHAKYDPHVDTNSQLCAGVEDANLDTCQGDSGGPLVYKNEKDGLWYLGGIVSWGYGCGDGGVYTRSSYYINWIKQQIINN